MIIWGKVIGAAVGLILLGPVGLILGLVFGQIFDNGLRTILSQPVHNRLVSEVFFKTVFQTMGYMAKVDGVVSENEIKVARDIMLNDFELDKPHMLLAIQYFNEGKLPSFSLEQAIIRFKSVCGKFPDLRRYFLEIQVKAAMADKILLDSERGRLVFICSSLGISLNELDHYLQSYGYNYYHNYSSRANYKTNYNYQSNTNAKSDLLADAYKVLGVNANDNVKTIKSAYRKLISKYHPDKLIAKGLPPEMLNVAKEKTQQLTSAYDLIMRSRGE